MGGAQVFLVNIVVVSILVIGFAAAKCGYESCPKVKEGYLNIHLVPHSHDDVGWLKTVDQYYYGNRNGIQLGAVQYTLDSVVAELQKSPDRRFIYVETSFFWRWWTNQDSETQNIVRNLVNSGQLEFIGGGWCMNDEATTHYNGIIDQMTLGLRYLNDTFGECALPRVAWQIDPFGHSREQASLFANMGYDGLFFGRLDYQDKFYRRVKKNMETIWSGSPNNLGEASHLFTGALFNGYNPPDGYCFDIFCGDDPINDDPKLLGYNLDKKVADFIEISHYWATPYRTKNVLMTMGSDFQYMAAHTWYKNLDKLIRHVNARQNNGSIVNLLYSTPSCYLQEVNKANLTWSVKTDDFFPYASDPHAFWTGYFSSRPTLKYMVHKTNNFFQACHQLGGLTDQHGETAEPIFKLAEPLGVNQHHDAVAGTAKQHVTDDYALRLDIGTKSCEGVIHSALNKLRVAQKTYQNVTVDPFDNESNSVNEDDDLSGDLQYKFCHLLNISSCDTSEFKSSFVLAVYNPLAWDVKNAYIRLPVSTPTWHVEGPQGDISSQAIPLPLPVLEIPGRISAAQYSLVFPAGNLAGLSVTNFKLIRVIDNEIGKQMIQPVIQWKKSRDETFIMSPKFRRGLYAFEEVKNEDFVIENSVGLSCEFDGESGLLRKIRRGRSEMKLKQNFYYYLGMKGNNTEFAYRASGAYIFRPNGTTPIPVADKVQYEVYKGEHVTEVHQLYSNWVSQVIRLYDKAETVEFEWLVGPIPIQDHLGKEVVARYSTDLDTNGVFFTDANGREILRRERNKRPTWKYKVYEPVAGNYYPVNSRIMISEEGGLNKTGKTVVVLNDRAQGGTSMNDGEMELMIHRRLLYDDAFGVGEALNEEAYGKGLVVRGKHWLLFAGGETGVPVSTHRRVAQEIFMDRIFAFRPLSADDQIYTHGSSQHVMESVLSKVTSILPLNCHLLTWQKLDQNQYLFRLEHFYERGEDQELSRDIKIPLRDLQQVLQFKTLRETILGGNQWKDQAKRFKWNIPASESNRNDSIRHEDTGASLNFQGGSIDASQVILLTPMQIRTFVYTT